MSKAHKSQYLRFRSIPEYLPVSIASLWLEHLMMIWLTFQNMSEFNVKFVVFLADSGDYFCQ